MLDLLIQAPRTVEELAQEAHMSVANTSQHLQRLKRARLVLDEMGLGSTRYALFPTEDRFNAGALVQGEGYIPSSTSVTLRFD